VSRSAIVVGAGIGGLCAALALRRAGLQVTVLERSPAIEPIGAGIWMWPNAIHGLRSLGVGDRVLRDAAPVGLTVRSARGRALADTGSDEFPRRFGAPLVVLARADLHAALLEALGPEPLRLGARCVAVDPAVARVELASGERLQGDVLVGADGLRSVVRAALAGPAEPRFSGYTAWRALMTPPPELAARIADCKYTGRGRIFVCVRLGDGSVFWAATGRADAGEAANPAVDRLRLLAAFSRWTDPVAAIVAHTDPEAILRHDLYDREPLARWTHGRTTLLGDAAHPMLPNLGQGACQAIEDAVVLGRAFAEADGTVTALRAYERARRPRAGRIVRQSRRMARLEHVDGHAARVLRDGLMRALPRSAALRQLAPIVGHHA
jgi:2-polyprenyl-6-methoxyphenol hydroxylase-like FAD-dependent oxidoreductase